VTGAAERIRFLAFVDVLSITSTTLPGVAG
jgi:hypothetical protein